MATAKKKAPARKTTKGRPTKYKAEYCEEVTRLCLLGLTDEQLAQYFEISVATLNTWKNTHPDFLEAIKDGKERADAKVGASLYNKALGYTETIKEEKIDKDGCVHEVEREIHVPPDTTAAIFWLKNRRKDDWRDQKQLSVDGEITHNHRAVAVSELNTLFTEAIEHSAGNPGSDGTRQGAGLVLEHDATPGEDGPVLPAEVPDEEAGRGESLVIPTVSRRRGKS
jgi:hypothetical protein